MNLLQRNCTFEILALCRLEVYKHTWSCQERERGFQQQIEELRTDNADGYNKCKIALEKGIQDFDILMGTYGLNHWIPLFGFPSWCKIVKSASSLWSVSIDRLVPPHSCLVSDFHIFQSGYELSCSNFASSFCRSWSSTWRRCWLRTFSTRRTNHPQ